MTLKSEADEKIEKLRGQVQALQEELDVWRSAGIPDRTAIILLQHYTKVPQRTIKLVLEGIDALVEEYFTDE